MSTATYPRTPRPGTSAWTVSGTEEESGTCTGTHHHHNGYYAGDFSDRPFPTAPLRDLVSLHSGVGGGW